MDIQPHWVRSVESWMNWVIFTGIAWPVGLILGKGLILIGFLPDSGDLHQFVTLITGGIVLAIVQLIYLAPEVRGRALWVLVTLAGWVIGAGVTWMFGQAGDSFFRYGWLLAGLIGGGLYGALQSVGFQPWAAEPISWISKTAMSWIASYALGAILLSHERAFNLSEFMFVSWAILGSILLILNILLIPKPRAYGSEDGELMWPSSRD